MKTIALSKTIEDAATGAAPSHHVLVNYQVDVINKKTTAMLVSYMTAAATVPVTRRATTLAGEPQGDATQWIYAAIVAMPDHPLSGAIAVTAGEGA